MYYSTLLILAGCAYAVRLSVYFIAVEEALLLARLDAQYAAWERSAEEVEAL